MGRGKIKEHILKQESDNTAKLFTRIIDFKDTKIDTNLLQLYEKEKQDFGDPTTYNDKMC